MGSYNRWTKKQSGNPWLLVIAGVSATITFWCGYKYYYGPWKRRNELRTAEAYAQFLMKGSQDK